VLKAGIAHIHLVVLHHFWNANERTARGLSTLVLQRSLYRFRKLRSLESHLSGVRDFYFTAIERALGGRVTLEYDATSWLEFFTQALNVEAEFLVGGFIEWHRMMDECLRNFGVIRLVVSSHGQDRFRLANWPNYSFGLYGHFWFVSGDRFP